jgi:lipopolysaccharide export system permease protein
MQFLWKYIDELVGKGLEWYLVAELLFYASANLVPMALPLAILLASIMTFGSFGEHYELVAMKSSGMGLFRIMFPLLIVTLLTSASAFMFTNFVWPKANLEFAALLYDIRNERYLLFELENGSSYEEVQGDNKPHMLSDFDKEIMRFDLSGFQMERTDKDIFKDNYQMLNLSQLETAIDTHRVKRQEKKEILDSKIYNRTFKLQKLDSVDQKYLTDSNLIAVFADFDKKNELVFLESAISNLRQSKSNIANKKELLDGTLRNINRHLIEWHRKFTLSIACIILFFIGAPLGAIIRKGGLGLPVVISVLFFLAYHITSITFEKLAKQGEMDPAKGMWIASMILMPIGLYLTFQASTDSKVLDMETYSKFFRKIMGLFIKSNIEANPSK